MSNLQTLKADKSKWFLQLKEQRLEALMRGGLLKQRDAHNKLMAFTQTVRRTVAWLEHTVLPREVIVLAVWAFVAMC